MSVCCVCGLDLRKIKGQLALCVGSKIFCGQGCFALTNPKQYRKVAESYAKSVNTGLFENVNKLKKPSV